MNFLLLPDDILHLIFLNASLKFDDLINLSRTCKYLHQMYNDMRTDIYYKTIINTQHRICISNKQEKYQILNLNSEKIIYDGYRFYIDKNRRLILSNYSYGKLDGSYQVYISGQYIDNNKSKLFIILSENKPILEGQYEQGIKTGIWVYNLPSYRYVFNYDHNDEICHIYEQEKLMSCGKLSITDDFTIELREGYWEIYSFDKEKFCGLYKHNLKTGTWKVYRDDKLIEEEEYKNDELNGYYTRYFNDNIIEKLHYVDGILYGICYKNYCDGAIKEIGYYQNNIKKGKWNYFYQAKYGSSLHKEGYCYNKRVGLWRIYYPDGTLKKYGQYENGKRNGRWIHYDKDGNLYRIIDYF